jgi:asparagine synthase (glutamine-hydrolysing)
MESFLASFDFPLVLDFEILAACGTLWENRLRHGRTLFQGISALPPGHYLAASETGVQLHQYWEPAIKPELVPSTEGEVWEKTAYLVERAVLNRIAKRKSVAVMYSGGLDSSVLAAVVSQCLRKLNRSFIAVAAVNDNLEWPVRDERSFMLELKGVDNMQLQFISAPGRGPFDEIEDASRFQTSYIRYSRHFLDMALAEAAELHGADVLLSGNFGEATISASPRPHLLEFLVRLQWPTFLKELRSLGRTTDVSLARLLGRELWRHVRGPARRAESYRLTRTFRERFRPVPFEAPPLWPDTREATLHQVRQQLASDGILSTRPRSEVFAPSMPFQDPNLLEFCLALPPTYKIRNGVSRYLLKRSFAHLLPPALAWRKCKTAYSPDYPARYNAQLPRALAFVDAISRTDPVREIVDVDRFRRELQPFQISGAAPPGFLSLPRTIYLINFLRRFPAFQG